MKLYYHKKARDNGEAIGAGGKQENLLLKLRKLLKLLKLPELGKLESTVTSPLSYMFTLLSLINKYAQLTNAYIMLRGCWK